jgi:hypothetical protein
VCPYARGSPVPGVIADFERDLIRERTGEGRTRAMANGVKFGRKRKLSDYHRAEAIRRRDAGETLAAIAKSYDVAISMIRDCSGDTQMNRHYRLSSPVDSDCFCCGRSHGPDKLYNRLRLLRIGRWGAFLDPAQNGLI